MYNEMTVMKISKKAMLKELVDLAKTAWHFYHFEDPENTEKFRFHFNYFYNNNREVQRVDYMYDEPFSHPHFHYVLDKYPKIAAKVEQILQKEGIDLSKMQEKFDKIMASREPENENMF